MAGFGAPFTGRFWAPNDSNWRNTTFTPVGGSETTEIRQHNKLNEITAYGSTPVLYDQGNNPSAGSGQPGEGRGNGNVADDGTFTYSYDALNRLSRVYQKSDGSDVSQYAYDALNRRVMKNTADDRVFYYYDGNQCIQDDETAIEFLLRQYVWGQYIDELIEVKIYMALGAQSLGDGHYYLLSDLLYRSQALTDSSGDIVEAYDCDAYGNTIIFQAAGTGGNWWADDAVTSDRPACEYIFQGRQYDPETRIYFYRARYYIPKLGRFMSRDQRFVPNLYQYVRSNPSCHLDPSGLDPVSNVDWTTEIPCSCCHLSVQDMQRYEKIASDRATYYSAQANNAKMQIATIQSDLATISKYTDPRLTSDIAYATSHLENDQKAWSDYYDTDLKGANHYQQIAKMFADCIEKGNARPQAAPSVVVPQPNHESDGGMDLIVHGLVEADKPVEYAGFALANVTGQGAATVAQIFITPFQASDWVAGKLMHKSHPFLGDECPLSHHTMWQITQFAFDQGWKALWNE